MPVLVRASDQSKRKPKRTKHDHDRGKHVAGSSSKKLKPRPPYSQRRYKTKIVKKSESRTKKKERIKKSREEKKEFKHCEQHPYP